MNHSYATRYDQDGNLRRQVIGGKKVFSFAYDAENHLVGISGDDAATTVYDADGQRVKASFGDAPNVTTVVTVGSHFEQRTAGSTVSTTKYYFAGNMRVAMRTQTGASDVLHWLLSDTLGSTTTAAGTNGELVASAFYEAWGETTPVVGDLPTARRYTGQLQDPSIAGIYYYGARYYDPALGRFLQADTIVLSPENPQSLNRYSYVLNNSLRYADPTGHYEFEDSPDDPYRLPRIPGIMPARRSRIPYAYANRERRQLILHHGKQLQSAPFTSLEKFARLTEYSASLYATNDVDNFMLNVSHVILGWSRPHQMWRVPPREERSNDWLGFDAYPDWSGWSPRYVDASVPEVPHNNQMYQFWFYAAVRYFDGAHIAWLGNRLHEMRVPGTIAGISTGPLGNNGQGVSRQDYELGLAGIAFGGHLARGSALANKQTLTAWPPSQVIYINQTGDWLRANLGGVP